jgi:hypothetical protein
MFGLGCNKRSVALAVGNPNPMHRTRNGHQYETPLVTQLVITGVLLVTKSESGR